MKVTTYTNLRQNLASLLDGVQEDHEPLLITRGNGRHAVVLSLDDFNAFQETAYLTSTPANARRLKESIAALRSGGPLVGKTAADLDRMAE